VPRPIACIAVVLGGCTAAALAGPPSGDWRLTFADEFAGSRIDNRKWITQYPWGPTHNHEAYSRAQNVSVGDGLLTLTARREWWEGKPFTTGTITSGMNLHRFSYGYIESRIKMPSRRGSWPAFWMLDDGWPPEIDIMENPLHTNQSTLDTYYTNYHYLDRNDNNVRKSNGSYYDTNVNLSSSFNNYGLEWSPTVLRFYFNGTVVKSTTNIYALEDFTSMYLLLNYAVGGWPGTPSTTQWPMGATDTTQAEYVRIWQRAAGSATSRWTANVASGSWTTGSNWSAGAPTQEGQTAQFGTLAGRSATTIDWSAHRAITEMLFDGTTRYTLGSGDENMMFVDDRGDDWAGLMVVAGATAPVFNTRLDLYSNFSAWNAGEQPLVFNGEIIDQFRGDTASGIVRFGGSGQTQVNARVFTHRDVWINGGSTTILGTNGRLYQSSEPLAADVNVEVNAGSTLEIGSLADGIDGSFGNLPLDASRVVLSNGTLRLRGGTSGSRGITVTSLGGTLEAMSGATAVFNASSDPANGFVLNGRLTLTGAGNGVINKVLTGPAPITKSGTGFWTLNGDNTTYAGTIDVTGGSLVIGHGNALGSTAFATTVGPGASLSSFSRALTIPEPVSLTDASIRVGGGAAAAVTWTGPISLAGTTATIQADGGTGDDALVVRGPVTGTQARLAVRADANATITLDGPVSLGSGGITRIGAGTLRINGTATATGDTFLDAGTTFVNGTLNGSRVVVNAATLGGTGRVGNEISLRLGASLQPGDAGIGTLRAGSLAAGSGSTMQFEIASASTFDQLIVEGAASVAGGVSVSLLEGFTPANADTFTLVSAGAMVAEPTGLNPFGRLEVAGGSFRLDVVGSDLVLGNFLAQLAKGDTNLDGAINNQDIGPFVAALTSGEALRGDTLFVADVNLDGVLNNQDIGPFVALLTAARVAPGDLAVVPEPSALGLLALASVALRRRRR
jgi:autotransporter-associated beta strand protein